MANTKDIQRRIKSIGNTKKITRAMEMVAAAKMRKAIESTLATRTYASLSWETLLNLTRGAAQIESHPLLTQRSEIKKQAIIVISSNRGLCGGFNASIMASVRKLATQSKITTDIVLVGRKGGSLANTYNVVAQFSHPETGLDTATVAQIINFVKESFLSGRYDSILVAYTDFINAAKQIPRVKQLLPIKIDSDKDAPSVMNLEYIFEPAPEIVLEAVVPRLLEVQLYQAFLESMASEHSARMSSMHQATQAASDLAIELTLFYNKTRQSAITAEIAEITAGVAALE